VRQADVLVTDADEVRTYYRVRHDTDSMMIPYGADPIERGAVAVPLPVTPDAYVLYVSRWERENNPVLVATAHALSGIDLPLVMLGQATYDDGIDAEVRAAAAPHALLPGPVFGDGYRGLQANALCYVHATEVGGTHPALIEALGAGNVCLVMDTPENREVVGEHGEFFADAESLAALLRRVVALPPDELARRRAAARAYAAGRYSWDAVAAAYLDVLE
jgi:glycosyltransferase involved in cell wall biosynthesis